MSQDTLIISIVWLAVLSPGADFAMVSRSAFLHGRQAGLLVSLGIAISCWFHVFYAIFGLTLIQHFVPHALTFIRLAGAAYLIYMGLSAALGKRPLPEETPHLPTRAGSRVVFTGILTNGLNPKTSIFVISLYSQVIGPHTPLYQQLGWGAFISLSHLAWFALVSVFLSRPTIRAFVLRQQRVFNLGIGLVLTCFGLLLLGFNPSAPVVHGL